MKRFISAILSIVLSVTLCMPLVSGYADCDSEDLLLPYRNVFDEFNATHGTTYGFMTDEQLSAHNMNRDEYYQEMENVYTAMTVDEFIEMLENAYIEDMKFMQEQQGIAVSQTGNISADTLPYYIKEENTVNITVTIPAGEGVRAVFLGE